MMRWPWQPREPTDESRWLAQNSYATLKADHEAKRASRTLTDERLRAFIATGVDGYEWSLPDGSSGGSGQYLSRETQIQAAILLELRELNARLDRLPPPKPSPPPSPSPVS